MSKFLPLLVAVAGTVLATGVASGAMAPQFNRWQEFGAVVSAAEIPQKLYQQGPIERIERTAAGTYKVSAGRCYVTATVSSVPRRGGPVPGTEPLSVSVSDVRCD